jgi:4-hydroxybenzoate polyprenyltransferase
MSKSRVFLFILLSFLIGIFVRSFWQIGQDEFFLLLLFALVLLFIFYRNKFATFIAFILLAFVLGSWLTDGAITRANNLSFLGRNLKESVIVQKVSQTTMG